MRVAGLEPALLAEQDFESSASTNFTTPAQAVSCRPDPSSEAGHPSTDQNDVQREARPVGYALVLGVGLRFVLATEGFFVGASLSITVVVGFALRTLIAEVSSLFLM